MSEYSWCYDMSHLKDNLGSIEVRYSDGSSLECEAYDLYYHPNVAGLNDVVAWRYRENETD